MSPSRLRSGTRSARAYATIFAMAFVALTMFLVNSWADDNSKDDKNVVKSGASNDDSVQKVENPTSPQAAQRPGTRPATRPATRPVARPSFDLFR